MSPPSPESSPQRSIRLRLIVGVPVALALVALTAGVGAINVLLLLEPSLEANAEARFWAVAIVVVFSLVAGGLGLWMVRVLQRPLEEMVQELGRRVEREPGVVGGQGTDAGSRALAVPPAEEVVRARRTLDAYLRSLDEYRADAALLEEMEEGILVLDATGRIVHANRKAAEILDVTRAGLVERSFESVAGAGAENLEVRSLVRRSLQELSEAKPGRRTAITEEVVVGRNEGPGVPVTARCHVVTGKRALARMPGGSAVEEGALLLALRPVDETESESVRSERLNRLAELGTLVAEVAHEVRNPLGSLRSMAELLAERLPGDDPKRDHLERLEGEIDRVTRYLDELLDYSQPRTLERREMELTRLLEEACDVVRGEAAGQEVALEVETSGATGRVYADRDRLVQVLVNLLRNGVQHADRGGRVTLSADRGPAAGDGIRIQVHNTDSYIPDDRREEIFRPFTSTREGGTGLGLPLSRYLVRLHGGSLSVESDPEGGTTFRVELPTGPAGGSGAATGSQP